MTDIFEGEKRLQTASATRWNLQLRMIRSVMGAPEEKLKELDVQQLTAYERKQRNNVSASLTVFVTTGIKHQMQQISTTYNNTTATTLKSSIQQRLSDYRDDGSYLTAAVVRP